MSGYRKVPTLFYLYLINNILKNYKFEVLNWSMDYKLKTFKVVAQTQSFSKAAKVLNVSQPAVSKCIKHLEEKYKRAFFERKANAIELTKEGVVFLEYAEQILQLYDRLEDEYLDGNRLANEINIGASTTIANYLLPILLAAVKKDSPELKVNVTIGNTLEIQQAILKKEINLGIVEGGNHNTRLHYSKFVKDELVLVSKYNQENSKEITLNDLLKSSIVGRELGSGTREIIETTLRKQMIDIPKYDTILGSTESIKNYLLNSQSSAFLSMYSIVQELRSKQLRIIDVEELEIHRWFYWITRQGFQSKLTTKIQNLLLYGYNQKE